MFVWLRQSLQRNLFLQKKILFQHLKQLLDVATVAYRCDNTSTLRVNFILIECGLSNILLGIIFIVWTVTNTFGKHQNNNNNNAQLFILKNCLLSSQQDDVWYEAIQHIQRSNCCGDYGHLSPLHKSVACQFTDCCLQVSTKLFII